MATIETTEIRRQQVEAYALNFLGLDRYPTVRRDLEASLEGMLDKWLPPAMASLAELGIPPEEDTPNRLIAAWTVLIYLANALDAYADGDLYSGKSRWQGIDTEQAMLVGLSLMSGALSIGMEQNSANLNQSLLILIQALHESIDGQLRDLAGVQTMKRIR